MDKKYNEYVIDKDCCPDKDMILTHKTCSGCKYYEGFCITLGQRCVKCKFYQVQNNNSQE